MSTYARVIADSLAPNGKRLTTIEAEAHRYILAEINTHRAFSRNSASSRAVPVAKMMQRLVDDPALPPGYPAEQKGMQGGDELEPVLAFECERLIRAHRDNALALAEALRLLGLHKGNTNRYLEPWMWHKVIISATDWKNFFAQRASSASLMAIREFRDFADAIERAIDESTPVKLEHGEWHTPYVGDEDREEIRWILQNNAGITLSVNEASKCASAARCARVSYLTQDGVRDPLKDLALYERLSTADPMHASPLEHVATPCDCAEWVAKHHDGSRTMIVTPDHRGNFRGWDQLRHHVWTDPDDEVLDAD